MVAGRNPFDGFTPAVPQGTKLDYGSTQFQELEDIGQFHCPSLQNHPLTECSSVDPAEDCSS